MPQRKQPKEIDPAYLERAFIQVNVRVPLHLRLRIDEFLTFMEGDNPRRPNEADDWPKSLAGLVMESLEDFLDSHPLKERRGPDRRPKDYTKVKDRSKIKAKTTDQ